MIFMIFPIFPFSVRCSRFSFLVSCFRNIHGHKRFLVGWKRASISSQCQLNLMCHFSNSKSSFVRNDIIFRYIVKKCLVATVRKDGPERRKLLYIQWGRQKYSLFPSLLKMSNRRLRRITNLRAWRTDRLDHTLFEKEILKRLLVLAGYSW